MRKKTVVLCEFHEDDVIAQAVLHIGVCEGCAGVLAKMVKAGNTRTRVVKRVAAAKKGKVKRNVCSVCKKPGHNAKRHAR